MGAHNFTAGASGASVGDAYRSAVREAEYEDGHDAYNGTISTTNGVREIPAADLKGLGRKARVALVDALAIYSSRDELRAGLSDGDRFTPATRRVLSRLIGHYTAEKWGRCLAVELPREKGSTLPRGHRDYVFAGWAAS